MSSIAQYVNNDELPDDILLGRIVMFTVPETFVSRAHLEGEFTRLQLNPSLLPAQIKRINAFKKATTDADETSYPNPHNPREHCVLLTRKVTTDNEMVTRFIVREVRNEQRKTLRHDKVIETVFYKGGRTATPERARFTRVDDNLNDWEIGPIDTAIQQMQDAYDKYANFLDANAVRWMIRDYLKYLNAIELRGGVYFVHKSRTDELLRLREMVRGIGFGCRLDLIPLVDMDNERDIIIEAFQREAEQALMEVVRDCTFVMQTRKTVTHEAYTKLQKKYADVMRQAQEYQRTLQLTQDRTGNAADLADDALRQVAAAMIGDV